jgi:hypothetical protein
MTPTTTIRPADLSLRSALRLAAAFAAAKLLLTFALTLYTTHIGYSYFRDEFYYIACGHHLAWGYVDHGPIVAVQARLGELLFGDSVFAIRILSATAGAIMVFLTGLIAWALGGRRPAQALAMFGVICTPQYIGTDGFLSMNSCEPVFWMTCALALILMLKGRSQKLWWTLFGLSAGIGLLNKPSMTCSAPRSVAFSSPVGPPSASPSSSSSRCPTSCGRSTTIGPRSSSCRTAAPKARTPSSTPYSSSSRSSRTCSRSTHCSGSPVSSRCCGLSPFATRAGSA